jgi:hypothetical protein
MPASLRAVDLVLETADVQVELMLQRLDARGGAGKLGAQRAEPIETLVTPVRAGDEVQQREAEALYRDWSGGAGYGERLAASVYHYDAPGYSRTPYIAMPPGRLEEIAMPHMTGPIRGSFFSRADLFFVGGGQAVRLYRATGAPYLSQDLTVGGRPEGYPQFQAQSAVNWGPQADAYVGGIDGPLWRFDGNYDRWERTSDVFRQYLSTVYWVRGNHGALRLVGSTYPNASVPYTWPDRSISYTDNPYPVFESLWGEEILVGSPDRSITGLTSSGQHLWTLKSDGLYDLDDRLYSPNLTPSHGADPGGSKALGVFNGHVYYGTRRGMGRVALEQQGQRIDRPQMCGFGFGLPNYSPIAGEARAITSEAGWLAAAYYNHTSGTSYLCYGVDYRDLGTSPPAEIGGPLLWHGAEAVIPGVEITYLLPWQSHAAEETFLYLGGYRASTGRGTLHKLSLPRAGTPIEDLRAGGSMRFADEWTKYLPRESWGNDLARKDLTQIHIRGDNLGSATLDAYRAVDEEAFEAASLGQATRSYDAFAVDAETDSRYQTFKVTGRGTATTPAILSALGARAGVSVEASDVTTYLVAWGEGVQRYSGSWRGDPQWTEDALKAMQGRRARLVDNSRNVEATVRVLQGMVIEWDELPSGERTGRARAQLQVQVLETIWTLDSGKILDTPGLRLTG